MQNSFKVDYATENEEWLAQYKKVEASLEDIALDGNEKADWLVAATMVVRAGRLGLLLGRLLCQRSCPDAGGLHNGCITVQASACRPSTKHNKTHKYNT